MTTPFISIITPVFNQGRFLAKNIESVMAQGLDDVEHIVVDGGSTDETIEVLRAYPHVRWTSEPDRGQADALNKGVMMARGEVMSCLNGDDFYLPGAFDVVRREMKGRTQTTPLITGACSFVRDGIEEWVLIPPAQVTMNCLLRWYDNFISHPATFMTVELYKKAGWFDPNIKYAPDLEFWCRLVNIAEFKVVPEVLTVNLRHPDSTGISEQHNNDAASLYFIARHCGDNRRHIFVDMYMNRLNTAIIKAKSGLPSVQHNWNWKLLFINYIKTCWENLGYRTRLSGKTVSIFCAGDYTRWLLDVIRDVNGPEKVVILDDRTGKGNRLGKYPVLRPSEVDKDTLELIIIGTDTAEQQVKASIQKHFGSDVPTLSLHGQFGMQTPIEKSCPGGHGTK